MNIGLPFITIIALILLAMNGLCQAADPQPYQVNISKTDNSTLDQLLKDTSTLISLKDSVPVGSFALVARAKGDLDRFVDALHSQGYYQGAVEIRIADLPLDNPGIYDTIDYSPASPPVKVQVTVNLGPLFHLRHIEIKGSTHQQLQEWLGLKPNAPALASEVLAARERLKNTLREQGYALAKVEEPIASLDLAENALDVVFSVKTGRLATLAQIEFNGLKDVDHDFVRQRLKVTSGELFSPVQIEKARQDLIATGVFSSVRAKVGKKLDKRGQLPITFVMTERPKRTASLAGAYSTDLGGNFAVNWLHRNLLGRAEQLNLTVGMTQLGGNSTTGIGYNIAATFTKPDFLRHEQSLKTGVHAIRQSLRAYEEDVIAGELSITRKLSNYWSANLGAALEQAQITQQNETNDYTLFSIPASIKYDSTDSLLDPTRGSLAIASLTPIQPLAGEKTSPFIMMQLSAATFFNLAAPGRSILALRGTVGDIEGAGRFDLPPDKRYYAGGSTTVRGYKYQSIGPQFADGNPEGGTAIMAGTVEFRQRILDNYGAVLFVDAGQVSPDSLLLSGAWRVGAGVGLRYYTGFGPLRVDLAFPVNSQSNSGSYEIYIGLGQAF